MAHYSSSESGKFKFYAREQYHKSPSRMDSSMKLVNEGSSSIILPSVIVTPCLPNLNSPDCTYELYI